MIGGCTVNFRRAVLERPWRSRSDGYTGLMRGCLHPSGAIYMTAYSAIKSATLGSNDCVICTISRDMLPDGVGVPDHDFLLLHLPL
jgi:hypothetical protein